MRDRWFAGNVDKAFFHRLPNLSGDLIPPSYPGKSKQAIVIFPLFFTHQRSHAPQAYYIKTACWARRTWLMYTDALELDIPIKFYVEDILYDEALPIFGENGIDESDIIQHDASGLNPPPDRGPVKAKCLACCRDKRFMDYDWTLISDADLFLCKGLASGYDKFPFFQSLFNREKDFGCGSANDVPLSEVQLHHWLRYYHVTDPKARREQGLKDIESFTSPEFIKKITSGMRMQIAHGALYILPTRQFFKRQRGELDRLYQAVRLIRDDEVAVGMWAAFRRKRMWSTKDDFGIPYMTSRHRQAYQRYNIYFTHPNDQGSEYYWRKSIGSL